LRPGGGKAVHAPRSTRYAWAFGHTAVVFFSRGAFLSTFVYNPLFMRRRVAGEPLKAAGPAIS